MCWVPLAGGQLHLPEVSGEHRRMDHRLAAETGGVAASTTDRQMEGPAGWAVLEFEGDLGTFDATGAAALVVLVPLGLEHIAHHHHHQAQDQLLSTQVKDLVHYQQMDQRIQPSHPWEHLV